MTGLAAHVGIHQFIHGAQLLCSLQGSCPVMSDLNVNPAPTAAQLLTVVSAALHTCGRHATGDQCSIQHDGELCCLPDMGASHCLACSCTHLDALLPESDRSHCSLLCSPGLCAMCLGANKQPEYAARTFQHAAAFVCNVAGLKTLSSGLYPQHCLQLWHASSCWLTAA